MLKENGWMDEWMYIKRICIQNIIDEKATDRPACFKCLQWWIIHLIIEKKREKEQKKHE